MSESVFDYIYDLGGGPLEEQVLQTYMKRTKSQSSRPAKKAKLAPSVKAEVDREVKRQIAKNIDWRITDVGQSDTNVTIAGSITNLLQNLSRGDLDLNNFTGNSLKCKYLEVRWSIQDAATTGRSDTFRVVVGQSKKATGIPTIANLMTSSASGLAHISSFNNDYHPQFQILHDEMVDMQQYVNATIASSTSGKIFIPGNRLVNVEFDTALNNTAGGLFFFICAGHTAVTAPFTYDLYTRIKFNCM